MRILPGTICSGFGVATANLAPVMHLIQTRLDLAGLVPGTLNVAIPEEYIVKPDAVILPKEYGYPETVKLQRCVVHGYRSIIMRPDTHETRPGYGHGKNHLEILSTIYFRQTLGLRDGHIIEIQVEGDDVWWTTVLQ